jgi:hypothetical protein
MGNAMPKDKEPEGIKLIRHAPRLIRQEPPDAGSRNLLNEIAMLKEDIKRLKTLLAWCRHTLADHRDVWTQAVNNPTEALITYDEARRTISRLNGLLETLTKEDLP